MRRLIFVVTIIVLFFLVETVLDELFTIKFVPNFIVIFIVFLSLWRGIRYSLFAAFLGGLLKDSYAVSAFGVNIFSFILCAYLTIFIKKYVYHPGSMFSAWLLVLIITTLNTLIHYYAELMFVPLSFLDMVVNVLSPELVATGLATVYVFKKLKLCALRLYG